VDDEIVTGLTPGNSVEVVNRVLQTETNGG